MKKPSQRITWGTVLVEDTLSRICLAVQWNSVEVTHVL